MQHYGVGGSLARHPDKATLVGFQELAVEISPPQLTVGIELHNPFAATKQAETTIAAKTGNNRFWFAGELKFRALYQSRRFTEQIFAVGFLAGDGRIISVKRMKWCPTCIPSRRCAR
jgi:hypothetical protein